MSSEDIKMRVRIVKNYIDLAGEINRFIKGKNVIDIKYCVDNGQHSALIIYEERG